MRTSTPRARRLRAIVMETLLPWTAVAALLLALLYLAAPALANFLLFYPSRAPLGDPPTLAGVSGEVVDDEAADGVRLRHWWYDAGEETPTVVVFHGNAGHLGHRAFLAEGLLGQGVSVLLVGYRGYGASEGRPREEGLYRDGASALAWLRARPGPRPPPVLLGRSLGGAVATGVAVHEEVSGLILDSSFTTLEEVARAVYPFFPRFITGRIRGRFRTIDAVREVEAPVMVIHGANDELIPFWMGEAVYEAAPEPKEWLPIGDAGHNDLLFVSGADYFERVAHFVLRVAAVGPGGRRQGDDPSGPEPQGPLP